MDFLQCEFGSHLLQGVIGRDSHGCFDQFFYFSFEAAVENRADDPPEQHQKTTAEDARKAGTTFGTTLALQHEGVEAFSGV